MAEGLYRLGDYVYMESTAPPQPYQICRIEELRKNCKGSVEVYVKCFFRRRDLPASLVQLADRHASQLEEDHIYELQDERDRQRHAGTATDPPQDIGPPEGIWSGITEVARHQLKHRELFLSRQMETFRIDAVRGKCNVTVLNELESLLSYLTDEDKFYYSMVYDPNQKTLMVDKGEMRIGSRYQAEVPAVLAIPPSSERDTAVLETPVWVPSQIPDEDIEKFLILARSVGTFARALVDDSNNINRMPLRLGAATASRDITLFHALDTLHAARYDLAGGISGFVINGRPIVCCDELEAWTAEEANLFQQGLIEHKDFLYIQRRFFPKKSLKSVISYYYLWKTTQQYQIQRKVKLQDKQNDLKEVIVHLIRASGPPSQGPTNLAGLAPSSGDLPEAVPVDTQVKAADGGKACESCYATVSNKWHVWGDPSRGCRVCNHCMIYWRKFGGLKLPTAWEYHDKHPEQVYTCPQCKKQFNRQERLTNHMRQHQPHRCHMPNCDKTFKSKSTLRRHISGQHPNQPGATMQQLMPPTNFLMHATSVSLFVRTKVSRREVLRLSRFPFRAFPDRPLEVPEDTDFPLRARRLGLKYTDKRPMADVIEELNELALAQPHPTSPIVRTLLKGPLHSPKPLPLLLPDPLVPMVPSPLLASSAKRLRPVTMDSHSPAPKQLCSEETQPPNQILPSHYN